jgi:Ni,Fe-hydrogenase III small subunit
VGQYYASAPAFTAYFTWYDRTSSPGFLADDIHVVNPNGSPVSLSLSIPGSPGCYIVASVPAGQDAYYSCASGFGGPVVLSASARVLASQRVQYFQSFNEVPAQPSSAAALSFYFPWFDRASSPGFLADNIHVINPSSTTADVQVSIPGCAVQASSLPAGGSTYASCPNTIGGPVTVRSTNGVPILTSQRVQYYRSFNEVSGQAAAAASTSLYFSWFDRTSSPGFLADNIHVINPNSTAASVTVAIPGCGPQVLQVAPAGYQVATCASGFGGPVTVVSTNGVGVLASQRVQYYQSFNEVAAQALGAAKTALYFSWFDRSSSPGFLADNVHVVNPGSGVANVTVRIPGCGAQQLQVAAGAYQVATCAGGFGGPVSVFSTNGASVLASQRVQYYQSFNEVLAAG